MEKKNAFMMGFSMLAKESWFIAWEVMSGHFRKGAAYDDDNELSIPYHVVLQC